MGTDTNVICVVVFAPLLTTQLLIHTYASAAWKEHVLFCFLREFFVCVS